MKKLILLPIIAIFAITTMSAQGTYAGVNVGFPLGNTSDWKFAIQIDFGQDWEVSDNLDVGVATGYGHIFGGDIMGFDLPDYQYIPIAVTASLEVAEDFNIDADLGYAIGFGDIANGGFYYRPGFSYNVSEKLALKVNYTGISDDGFNATTFTVGTRLRF